MQEYWSVVFFPLYILASFVEDEVSISSWIYLWAFYSLPLIYVSISVPVPYYFDYCDFVVQFEIRECYISSFLSQDSFVYRGSLVFPYKFQNYLLQFCEKFCRYFDKDCIKLFCLG